MTVSQFLLSRELCMESRSHSASFRMRITTSSYAETSQRLGPKVKLRNRFSSSSRLLRYRHVVIVICSRIALSYEMCDKFRNVEGE
jgi:hypothetical protein